MMDKVIPGTPQNEIPETRLANRPTLKLPQ